MYIEQDDELPTWDECREKDPTELTLVETFIFNHQPAHNGPACSLWRNEFQSALLQWHQEGIEHAIRKRDQHELLLKRGVWPSIE